jgi:hypothetical protein
VFADKLLKGGLGDVLFHGTQWHIVNLGIRADTVAAAIDATALLFENALVHGASLNLPCALVFEECQEIALSNDPKPAEFLGRQTAQINPTPHRFYGHASRSGNLF